LIKKYEKVKTSKDCNFLGIWTQINFQNLITSSRNYMIHVKSSTIFMKFINFTRTYEHINCMDLRHNFLVNYFIKLAIRIRHSMKSPSHIYSSDNSLSQVIECKYPKWDEISLYLAFDVDSSSAIKLFKMSLLKNILLLACELIFKEISLDSG
jgi:hypothetical protein